MRRGAVRENLTRVTVAAIQAGLGGADPAVEAEVYGRDMACCTHMMPSREWTATLSAPYYHGISG